MENLMKSLEEEKERKQQMNLDKIKIEAAEKAKMAKDA